MMRDVLLRLSNYANDTWESEELSLRAEGSLLESARKLFDLGSTFFCGGSGGSATAAELITSLLRERNQVAFTLDLWDACPEKIAQYEKPVVLLFTVSYSHPAHHEFVDRCIDAGVRVLIITLEQSVRDLDTNNGMRAYLCPAVCVRRDEYLATYNAINLLLLVRGVLNETGVEELSSTKLDFGESRLSGPLGVSEENGAPAAILFLHDSGSAPLVNDIVRRFHESTALPAAKILIDELIHGGGFFLSGLDKSSRIHTYLVSEKSGTDAVQLAHRPMSFGTILVSKATDIDTAIQQQVIAINCFKALLRRYRLFHDVEQTELMKELWDGLR